MFGIRARFWWAAALLAALLLPTSGSAQETDVFAGTWAITLTPDETARHDGAKAFADAMVFEEGTLLTESFATYGFAPGEYVRAAETPNAFTATLQSGTKGNLVWAGSAGNDQIRGTLAWTKKDGAVWRFEFAGTKR